jgi:hypothetical protein
MASITSVSRGERIAMRSFVSILSAIGCVFVLSGCRGTNDIFDKSCVDRSILMFRPLLASDGSYRIMVKGNVIDTICTQTIVKGELKLGPGESSCSLGGAILTGGQSRTTSGTTIKVSGASSIEGIEWLDAQETQAQVTIERDNVVLRSENVVFNTVPTPDDCERVTGTNRVATIKLE